MVKEEEKEKNTLKHKRKRIELNKDALHELKTREEGRKVTQKKRVKKVGIAKKATKPKSLKSSE